MTTEIRATGAPSDTETVDPHAVAIRLRRIEAVAAVTQLFSRFHYLCAAGEYDQAADLLAQNTPGLSVELTDWGVHEGLGHAADALIGSLRRMATAHSTGLRQSRPDLGLGNKHAGQAASITCSGSSTISSIA